MVTEEDRLGDTFAHRANHSTAHKWVCAAWRAAIANSTHSTVFCGDRKLGRRKLRPARTISVRNYEEASVAPQKCLHCHCPA